jgi:tRNA dimethylallyltransferase
LSAKFFVAILGPTATGKSALGLALAERYRGEIVNCDSTAVYRGFDIGTDKVPLGQQRGIPHHLIDLVEPTDDYTAAQYAHDASAVIRDIDRRGGLAILVGGTGFYFRALTRGLFPGPGRDAILRARLESIAARKGAAALHRLLARVDAPSALRIQPRDLKRMVRALEVFFLTGRPLTAHFADTIAPLPEFDVLAIGVRLRRRRSPRGFSSVDEQFDRGLLDRSAACWRRCAGDRAAVRRSGLPPGDRALHGVRDEAATRSSCRRTGVTRGVS